MLAEPPRVLVVEDDRSVRDAVAVALRDEDWTVRALPDGRRIGETLRSFRPDVAVLDIRLPHGPDGLALARRIRASSQMPILFLTALDEVHQRLEGFEAGADDYLAKPFSMAELVARIRVLLRRVGRLRSETWQAADLVVDEAARTVIRGGNEIGLTRTEFDLLVELGHRRGQVLSKERLLSLVWEFDAYDPNLVEVHISSLRRKLEEHGERLVHTVRGVGYVLRDE